MKKADGVYYCTTWSCSKGIVEFDGYETSTGYVNAVGGSWYQQPCGYLGKSVFRTLEEAKVDAKRRADAAVKSSEKALARTKDRVAKYEQGLITVTKWS